MYMPRELSLSSEVPGCSVACETSCPRIVKTLTWIVFWVRIMMVPFRWKISTPSVFLGSVRLFPWTSALVSRHCTLAVARLVAAIVNSIANIRKSLLITYSQGKSREIFKCKNTTIFENRKNLEGIFSYYCLKIVNIAILDVKRANFAPYLRHHFSALLTNCKRLNITSKDCRPSRRQR